MKKLSIPTTLLLSFVLFACQDTPSGVSEGTTPMLNVDATIHMSSPEAFSNTPISRETLMERSKAATAVMNRFYRILASAEGRREADEAFREELASPSEIPSYTREQTAATLMLRTHLLGGSVDAEKREAVGYYTNLLVENRSPEAELIATALEELRGYWPDAQIRAAAARAASGVEVFLTKRLDRQNRAGKALARMGKNTDTNLRANDDAFLDRTASALERLREMSN